jgi:hypothetical protein
VHGLVAGYVLVEPIGVLYRAVLYAGGAARAFVLDDVARFFGQRDRKVACLSVYTIDFGIRENVYVGMPADLDQFGRENSHGAVVGRIGLVQLGHVAADGRGFFDQVDLEARGGQIQRGLDAADTATDHQDISEMILPRPLAQLFDRLVFHRSFLFLAGRNQSARFKQLTHSNPEITIHKHHISNTCQCVIIKQDQTPLNWNLDFRHCWYVVICYFFN